MQLDTAVPRIEKNSAANQNLCTVAKSSAEKGQVPLHHHLPRGGGGDCLVFKLMQGKKKIGE